MSEVPQSQIERRAAKRLRRVAIVMFAFAVVFAASSPILLLVTGAVTWWVPLTSAFIIAASAFSLLSSAQMRDTTAIRYEQRGL